MFGFNKNEMRVLRRLNAPPKIQDFLGTLAMNFEEHGDTYNSPRVVLREQQAHCLEGALLAAAALWINGEPPLIMNLKSAGLPDVDHVLTLFRRSGRWGAISKTNHAVLRYREPVYKSVRELAMSCFHEYFLDDGRKMLRSFSRPLDLRRFARQGWTIAEEKLDYLADALDDQPHEQILTPPLVRRLRLADPIEIAAGKLVEWRPGRRRPFQEK
ncbi:MAG: hypothetical protein HY978_02650 [Candidatus Liptonbacteria bacterium]|nr:hypothetical protein [Candidatus Liptonbacteria bacterium]